MFCSFCGAEVLDGDKFCRNCGAAIDAAGGDFGDAANPFALGSQTRSLFDSAASGVPINPWSAIKGCFRKYFNGRGRASRTEFWSWIVFLQLIGGAPLAIGIPAFMIAALQADGATILPFDVPEILVIGPFVYWPRVLALVCLCPTISLFVRRLHDMNYSGWMIIPAFMPFLILIYVVVLGVLSGTPGANRYGPNPVEQAR